MRTFPRELATLREFVEQRGRDLRHLAYDSLKNLSGSPAEQLVLGAQPATIIVIVELAGHGRLRVVIHGSIPARVGRSVAFDGFYKHQDGTVVPMPDDELYALG